MTSRRRSANRPIAAIVLVPSPATEVIAWADRRSAQAALTHLIPSSAQEEAITMTTSTANNTLLDGKTTERLDAMEKKIHSLGDWYESQLGAWSQRMRDLEGRVEELTRRVEELETARPGTRRRAHKALDDEIVTYLRDVEHGRWTTPQVLAVNLDDGRMLSGGAAADRLARLARVGRVDRMGGTGVGSRPLYRVRPPEADEQ